MNHVPVPVQVPNTDHLHMQSHIIPNPNLKMMIHSCAGDTDYLCSRDIDLDFDLMPSWKVKHNHNNSNSNSKLSDRAPYTPYTPYTDKIQELDFGVGRGRGRMSVVGESSDTADLLNFDVL
ncbi:unnamed protein product [Ambrosiozyma monospora]|uniref:Unnamed protein product n=1 Tax=Ambrosiozyma monospora TaxID=43982 RepID=A0A9W7DHC4_AMBMO|nr:unnamed protein product [Ambrosiozyma monospora]